MKIKKDFVNLISQSGSRIVLHQKRFNFDMQLNPSAARPAPRAADALGRGAVAGARGAGRRRAAQRGSGGATGTRGGVGRGEEGVAEGGLAQGLTWRRRQEFGHRSPVTGQEGAGTGGGGHFWRLPAPDARPDPCWPGNDPVTPGRASEGGCGRPWGAEGSREPGVRKCPRASPGHRPGEEPTGPARAPLPPGQGWSRGLAHTPGSSAFPHGALGCLERPPGFGQSLGNRGRCEDRDVLETGALTQDKREGGGLELGPLPLRPRHLWGAGRWSTASVPEAGQRDRSPGCDPPAQRVGGGCHAGAAGRGCPGVRAGEELSHPGARCPGSPADQAQGSLCGWGALDGGPLSQGQGAEATSLRVTRLPARPLRGKG